MRNFARKYLQNTRLFIILFLSLIIAGIISFLNIPRELTPTIEIPMMAIAATYPGANAQDVEELVTNKIETTLKSVKGIKEVTSSSSDNFAMVIVQFGAETNLDDAYNRVSQKMNQMTDLPSGVEKPTLYKIDFDDTPIWIFNLDGPDPVGLAAAAEQLREEIEADNLIDRVDVSGASNREIQLILNQEKVNQLGLNPQVISQTLGQHLSNLPAGSVVVDTYQFGVSIDKSIVDLETLRQTPIRINGTLYQVGDLVAVSENDKPGTNQSYQLQHGEIHQTVNMSVYKIAGQPIDKATQKAKDRANQFIAENLLYALTTIEDIGEEINKTFSDLTSNFIATIILVFAVMLLFLGFKEALISAICIPMVMFLTFVVMQVSGMTLNMMSLIGLLLALGLLVDNAIVVVTALHREYKLGQGKISALDAAVNVWEEFFGALISTNLTTIWAFLPLLLMTGIMGDYLAPLSIVVTIAILGSALVAFFISLPIGVLILDQKLPARVQKLLLAVLCLILIILVVTLLPAGPIAYLAALISVIVLWFGYRAYQSYRRTHPVSSSGQNLRRKFSSGFISVVTIEKAYRNFISRLMANKKWRTRTLVMIVIITIFAFIIPFTPAITTEFMPSEESSLVYLDVEFPVGTNARFTQGEMMSLLEDFTDFTAAKNISASLGGGGFGMMSMGQSSGNQFRITLDIDDAKGQPRPSQVAEELRVKYADYSLGKLTISRAQGDTMSQMGADVQLSIMGPDSDQLGIYAEQIADYLRTVPGTTNVQTSAEENPSKLTFVPDEQLLADQHLSLIDLNSALRTALNGQNLGTIKLDAKEYDLVFRYSPNEADFTELEKLMISANGQNIPLASLGHFTLKPNLGTINHQSYQPVNTITASALPGYSGTEINRALNQFVAEEMNLETGYGLATGGMNEIFDESMNSLFLAMVIAFFLILFTLVLQLASFRQAAIVMSVIPVSISGVFILFGLAGITFSIPSVIGILALFGIVVNNSILIIERINQNLVAGEEFNSAIIEGAVSRLQPIIMTSLTTIIGLLPITLSDVMWRGLGGAIIAGLTFSGVLLLLYIPILYSISFNPAKLQSKEEKWITLKTKLFNLSAKSK